jgi:thiol-disulfide isomerase/thioredoxin
MRSKQFYFIFFVSLAAAVLPLGFSACTTADTGGGAGGERHTDQTASQAAPKVRVADLTGIDPVLMQAIQASGEEYTEDINHVIVNRTQVEDFSGLKRLPNLEWLNIYYVSLTPEHLSQMAGLDTLKGLFFYQTGLTDLSPLPLLPKLEQVYLYYNKFQSLKTIVDKLKDFPNLHHLAIDGNKVDDFELLIDLPQLTGFSVAGAEIEDVEWVKHIPQLEELTIARNKVSSIAPLADLEHLRRVDISSNPVEDLSPLANDPELYYLSARDTKVDDISVLSDKERLGYLYLTNCGIKDISPIENSKYMRKLDLSGNRAVSHQVLPVLKSMRDAGSFERKPAEIGVENMGLDFRNDENYRFIQSLIEAGIEVAYRKGNTPPPFDADTGKAAPAFTLIDQNGEEVSLEDFKGKYVYIQVSAEWCGYCHVQAEHFGPFHKELERIGVRDNFVSVVMLSDKEDREEVQKKWVKDYESDYILIPKEGENLPSYTSGGIPSMTLVLPTGNIAAQWSGASRSYEGFKDSLYSMIPELFE